MLSIPCLVLSAHDLVTLAASAELATEPTWAASIEIGGEDSFCAHIGPIHIWLHSKTVKKKKGDLNPNTADVYVTFKYG
jgi:hypothetical protein